MKKTNYVSAGANNATAFDDADVYEINECRFPDQIVIFYGEAIDQIGLCYGNNNFPLHGKSTGGNKKIIQLSKDEHIIKISGEYGAYWNNFFLFSLKFHTDQNRTLGIDNPKLQGLIRTPFEINFDQGYALACIFGETAPPKEGTCLKNISFLSGIGAYQIPLQRPKKGAEFAMYAQPVRMTGLKHFLDHTGVNIYYNNEKYQFLCNGTPALDPSKEIVTKVYGSLDFACVLATGKINQERKENIYKYDYCGIRYGVTGVCHQMTNRILFASGTLMPVSKVYGSKISHMIYGSYGDHWDSWQDRCNKLYEDNYTGASRIIMEDKPISILNAGDTFPADYELTQKLLELENNKLPKDEALRERIKLILDIDGEKLEQVYKQIKGSGKMLMDSEPQTAEQYANKTTQLLESINTIVGEDKFQTAFNCSLKDIK